MLRERYPGPRRGGPQAVGTLAANKISRKISIEAMGNHRPDRIIFGASELPKPGVFLTTNPAAINKD
jgi:hypothetical protein